MQITPAPGGASGPLNDEDFNASQVNPADNGVWVAWMVDDTGNATIPMAAGEALDALASKGNSVFVTLTEGGTPNPVVIQWGYTYVIDTTNFGILHVRFPEYVANAAPAMFITLNSGAEFYIDNVANDGDTLVSYPPFSNGGNSVAGAMYTVLSLAEDSYYMKRH